MYAKLHVGYGKPEQKEMAHAHVLKTHRNLGASITPSQKRAALEKVRLHNSWFTEHVMRGDTVIVLPRYNLEYRDDYMGYILFPRIPLL